MEGPPVYSFGLKSVLLMGLNLFSELEEIAETGSQVILWVGETLWTQPVASLGLCQEAGSVQTSPVLEEKAQRLHLPGRSCSSAARGEV